MLPNLFFFLLDFSLESVINSDKFINEIAKHPILYNLSNRGSRPVSINWMQPKNVVFDVVD